MSLNRETAITYLGHSTVLIETPGGKRILIDPFTISNPACPEEYKTVESLGKLDLILLTHAHGDHSCDTTAIMQANPETPFVAIYDLGDWLHTQGVKNFAGMNKGGTQQIAGISVTMTHAFHSSSYPGPDGTAQYGGEPVGYILTLENGFTLYAAGDTALYGDMALLKELYQPTLALLPIGDHFTMGPKEAAVAIRLLGVTDVIPIHYGTYSVLTGTPEALREHTAALPNLTIHALKPGETLR